MHMAQICSMLSQDFEEITQVMPWIDFAWEVNQDLAADQVKCLPS